MWDLIVSVPDHCLSFYFTKEGKRKEKTPVVGSWVTKSDQSQLCTQWIAMDQRTAKTDQTALMRRLI